jgi:predicted metal-binding membrane protein
MSFVGDRRHPQRERMRLAVLCVSLVALALMTIPAFAGSVAHGKNSGLNGSGSTLPELVRFLVGWALMMLAMMLPTAMSLLASVGQLGGNALAAARLHMFVSAGFIATWMVTGLVFRIGDDAVHSAVNSSDWLSTRPELVGSTTLLLAGAFQFSSLKRSCLTACQQPRSFIYRHWHGIHETREAARIGAAYGLSCVGCCWALMLVMFAFGIASAGGMFAFGAVMALEKNTAFGRKLTVPVGIGLILGALWLAVDVLR